MQIIDRTGQRFGHWIVISRANNIPRKSGSYVAWLCLCDCGNKVIIRGDSLACGQSTNCGCVRVLPDGEASFHGVVSTYKANSKTRGINWELTNEQVKDITQQLCFYCGIPPAQNYRNDNGKGDYIYNGIDRIDSKIGYIPSNVVPCCKKCNWAKQQMTYEEFVGWVSAVYNNLNFDSRVMQDAKREQACSE